MWDTVLISIITSLFSSGFTAGLAYYFSLKGKRKENDLEKIRELNNVLSNLLLVWHYIKKLNRLTQIHKLKESNFPYPIELFSSILIKSGTLNENCFTQFENSVEALKKHDPVLFFQLEGLGRQTEFIKRDLILPLINVNQENPFTSNMAAQQLKDLLSDIEDNLLVIAEHLEKEKVEQINKLFEPEEELNVDDLKKEILELIYNFFMSLLPPFAIKPNIIEFEEELSKPEMQEIIRQQLELFNNSVSIDQIMNLAIKNPDLSMDEITNLLKSKN